MLPGKIIGTASDFSRFWAKIPKSSQYSLPTVMYESFIKCFDHKREVMEGPSQSFLCNFTALIHFLLRLSSLVNLCMLYLIPVVVLQSAAMHLHFINVWHFITNSCTYHTTQVHFWDIHDILWHYINNKNCKLARKTFNHYNSFEKYNWIIEIAVLCIPWVNLLIYQNIFSISVDL